jgi:hypothetical protein
MLEKPFRERTSWVGDDDVAAELREELEQLCGVPQLVEQVGAEDDVERSLREKCSGLVPPHALDAEADVVSLGVRAQQCDGVVGPVGGDDVGAAERCSERGQTDSRAELDDALALERERLDEPCERDAARPELGPVRQELFLVERRLVDQLIRARRAQERQGPACELELLLDQRAA